MRLPIPFPARRRRPFTVLPAALVIVCLAAGCTAKVDGTATAGAGADSAFSAADGLIPQGETVSPFADVPAIANLDPALRAAVQQAAGDAAAKNVEMRISSGWRSERYQNFLLQQATSRYGGEDEARRFVRTAETSSHVTGHAVDVLPTRADDWLIQHGAAYGLCQSYANEMWHFELSVAPGGTCPAPASDADAAE
ncbi:M15 family metallopeptidase [Pseudonocardia xinjiangensis]|uniref:M15 family metallopeptidase n=1 Tax=Pseudonocardia xinjiangensis TaxID=75289 RepID=UPI003D8C9F69